MESFDFVGANFVDILPNICGMLFRGFMDFQLLKKLHLSKFCFMEDVNLLEMEDVNLLERVTNEYQEK